MSFGQHGNVFIDSYIHKTEYLYSLLTQHIDVETRVCTHAHKQELQTVSSYI